MRTDKNIKIMGIVNLTDDSYFADSRCENVEKALSRVGMMVAEGADIIDIGACSTRPGSLPVGEDEEWLRLEPVLKAVRQMWPQIEISIDTYWSSVVRKAYDLIGNFIVNDISAGEDDPQMLETVGKLGLTYVAMHKRGTPSDMQNHTIYNNVTEEIVEYFRQFAIRAEAAGIRNWILDPGFGFAKTMDQNYELLKNLSSFQTFGRQVLVGVSRKSMIYKRFSISPQDSLPATQVLHFHALSQGATILRVHDVAEALRTVALYKSLV